MPDQPPTPGPGWIGPGWLGPDWIGQLARDGYVAARGLLDGGQVREVRAEFDRLFEAHPGGVDQRVLLTSPVFLRLLEDSAVTAIARQAFGDQLQLLMYVLRRGESPQGEAARRWHRDFDFITDRLISLNVILYLDDLDAGDGATAVLPGSHHDRAAAAEHGEPVPGEVLVPVRAGDAVLNWSTLIHSGTPRTASGPRRLVLLYFGHWWLKRYEHDSPLPWQAYENAPQDRLKLLGAQMPGRDLHVDPGIAGHPWL
jgi:hypothetical protein